MHGAAFAALGLPHTYEAIHVKEADLPAVVERVRAGDLFGINVTRPHKRRILELVDAVDVSAAIVGATNTLVRDPNGRVVAYNTDVPALADELRRLAPEVKLADGWMTASALVLGTGATARSAIVALAFELGVAQIVVRGRAFDDVEARDRFAAEMDEILSCAGLTTSLRLEPWRPSSVTEPHIRGIIQATSAGMTGADAGNVAAEVVAWEALPKGAVALDVVYEPRQTPFLTAATGRGVRASNGLGMLARQGALALEHWLGVPAPFQAMMVALS